MTIDRTTFEKLLVYQKAVDFADSVCPARRTGTHVAPGGISSLTGLPKSP